ncbi:serine/threonine-protein kinase fray2 [Pyrus x bretschneideri]|uniref:serine/threonine-protein kinase fray2 n=1 Tax=Pyrus x bretschneideri TaxID=225117 RepID=UPI0008709003|nr:serine/threonine-protein kinase fray2 [Pyrus x bretschneideri]
MSPELTANVRLVRCPKCRQLLAELPDIPVYKCGGCGVTLQAKARVNGLRSKSASLNDTEAAQRIRLDHASEDKKSRSSARNATLSESGECSSDQENARDQKKSSEGSESSTSSTPKATYPESGNCFSNQNNEKDEDKPSEEEKSSSSSHNAAPGDQENERDQKKSSEGNESSTSSTPKATYPESGNFFSNQNNEKNEDKPSEEKKSSSSSNNAALPEQNDEGDRGKSSEDNESSSPSTRELTFLEPGRYSSDQNNEKSEDKSSEVKESSISTQNASLSNPGEYFSDQNKEKSEDKSSEDEGSSTSGHNASLSKSGECASDHNNETDNPVISKSSEGNESSSLSPKATVQGECFSDLNNEKEQIKSSEGNKFSSSSPKSTFPDSGECLLDQNNERDLSEPSEGKQLSSSSPEATFPDSGKCFSEQDNKKSEIKSSDDKEFGSSNHGATLPDSGECTSDQTSMKGPNESSEDCDHEQAGDINLPNEDQNNQSDQNDSRDFDSEKLEVSNEFCSSTEFARDAVKETLPKTRKGAEVSTNDESSPLGETNVDVGINKEIDSDFQSSNTVNQGEVRGNSSIVAAHMAAREIISSDSFESSHNEQQVEPRNSVPNGFDVTAHMAVRESIAADSLTSSPNGQLKEPQNSAFSKGFDHVGSPDAFGNTEFFPSLELSGAPRDLSRSPANRSHHAYDASVSSYDGMDDQFFNRNTRSNIVHSEERIRRDKFMANSMMTRDPGLQRQARDPWSNLPVKNDHAMKYRKWDQDALLPPRRQGHPSQDWNRLQSDEYMSRMAFRRRVSQGGYKNRGLTNQLHNEYQHNSGYQSSEMSVEDKRTLLRMVYELQDQVNNLNGKASGRDARGATWKEKSMAQYRDYEASEEELYHDPNYQRYLRRHMAGSHYPPEHHCKNMRIPFSSEATTSRHQADSSYLHYEPQDWQCSAPLPQPVRCCNNGLCRVHPGHSCWTSYDESHPSTPEQYVESDFPLWGRETMSDDLRHQRHDVNKLYRQKQHLAKRHFRPIAGGAPIITCYNCSKLLQIPADFLLFKRRYHRLRCGACLEVLRFSLRKRSHIVPYEQNAIAPPPSEVGDYNAAANGGNLAQHADTVSCSDDYGYGPSYYNGYSTDGDPGALAPSNSPRGDSKNRNMSYTSLDQMKERKELVLRQSRNKDKNPIETFVPARPSLSSEIEELPAKSSSPLHKLMGYASPSQVIRGSRK